MLPQALAALEEACHARWDAMTGPQLALLIEGIARLAQPPPSASSDAAASNTSCYAPSPAWTANLKRALLQRWGELPVEAQHQVQEGLRVLEGGDAAAAVPDADPAEGGA